MSSSLVFPSFGQARAGFGLRFLPPSRTRSFIGPGPTQPIDTPTPKSLRRLMAHGIRMILANVTSNDYRQDAYMLTRHCALKRQL